MQQADLLIRNAVLPDGRRGDISIAAGKFAALTEAEGPHGAVIDAGGALALPGLVDGHMHLDKSLDGLDWASHAAGADRESRIRTEKEMRRRLPNSAVDRARTLAERALSHGTIAIRSHVDIDDAWGLAGFEAVLDVREAMADRQTIQIVAFPQSGIMRTPGVADLLDEACANGADLVGGLDPASIDEDPKGQLDVVFGLAERHGIGVDIHLHDGGSLGAWQLRLIADRTAALGMQGRVTVSHAFALGSIAEAEFGSTVETLATAGVAIATHGAGGATIPPLRRLIDMGVSVFAGSDNVRDAWSPFGAADMLERANLIANRQDWRRDRDLEEAFRICSAAPAAAIGLADHGLEVGNRADLVLVDATCVAEAVAQKPPRRLVVASGEIVLDRTGETQNV